MSIKIRSKKQEFEYNGKDDDKWVIRYIENENRKYIQIAPDGTEESKFLTYDVQMILDLADQLRELSGQNVCRLPSPIVVDHRNMNSSQIESSVQASMSKYKDDAPVSESLTIDKQDAWFQTRTGVQEMNPVSDTPEDLKKVIENDPNWVDRTQWPRPPKRNLVKGFAGGGPHNKFKRVGASEII